MYTPRPKSAAPPVAVGSYAQTHAPRSVLAALVPLILHAADYAGSDACKACHPAEYAAQSKSAHARALAKGEPEWAFGAGQQAITYVSQIDGDTYLEHGLSYYPATKSKALTPGHATSEGVKYRTFDPSSAILRCFQCHSTGPLSIAEGRKIAVSEMGIRCEGCHGPAAEHVTAKGGRFTVFNPKLLNGAGANDFCGACHRKPPRPDEDTEWSNPWNVRHQPVYLSQSSCFIKSAGSLTCMTCHEPHSGKTIDSCASCHQGVKHKAAVAGKTCASCHMPRAKAGDRLSFANHWIGVYPPGNTLRPRAARGEGWR